VLLGLNLMMIIYVGSTKPLTWRIRNRIELFNEACIIVVSTYLVVFTDWVTDPLAIQVTSLSLLGVFFFCLSVNLSVVFYFAFLTIKNVVIKYWRIGKSKWEARRTNLENKEYYSKINSFLAEMEKYK
jgi:hypothetical protein